MSLGEAAAAHSLRFYCVVDGCEWFLDDADGDRFLEMVDQPWSFTDTETVGQAARRVHSEHVAERERLLREHLDGHDVLEFVQTIARLRAEGRQ